MLSPLTYPVATRHSTPSIEPKKNDPSPYDPPSDLTPGAKNVRTHRLLEKSGVTFSREITWNTKDAEKPKIVSSRLVVETGDDADRIHVRSWPGDKLQFIINGTSYLLDAKAPQGPEQSLWIKANGGDDRVIVDDDVKHVLQVDGGRGHDFIQAGGGISALFGGAGNDNLILGGNDGYAEGNDGDDLILGGQGNTLLFGNEGNDRLYAGVGNANKQNFLDGGDGDDSLYAGTGNNVLNGGNGRDHLTGYARTAFYNGEVHHALGGQSEQKSIFTRLGRPSSSSGF
ncbi:calcium-binding protein [Pseudomonas lactis]|uniref:calcium-binding protein n=1 Tax=Pseudomonas lactis TaxID=1615674 RepID=UPI00188617C8|nr:calcium-binding protein [Pseudomonas lactis]